MSEVYALVKQVPGRPNGEFTLHGVTDAEIVAGTWSAAGGEHIAFWLDTDESPQFDPYQWEEETAE